MSNPGWPHAHADTDFNNNSNYTYSHHDHAQFPHHKPPPHGQTSSFSPSPLSHPTDTTTSSPAPPACSHLNPDPRPLRTYLLRTTITIAFLLAIFGLIKVYANMTVIDDQQKLIFNMAVILLTLWVGVNMTIAQAHYTDHIKWGIIYSVHKNPEKWDFRQDKKFTNIHGLRTMLKYWAKGKDREGKNRVSGLLVTVWLLWNFAVCVVIGGIGLTYGLDPGGIGMKQGKVSIVDLSHYFPEKNSTATPAQNAEWSQAKIYSDISLGETPTTPETRSEDPRDHDIERVEDQLFGAYAEGSTLAKGDTTKVPTWRYNFREWDPDHKVVVRSNRYIRSQAQCESADILKVDYAASNITYRDPTDNSSQTIGPVAMIDLSTSFLVRVNPTDYEWSTYGITPASSISPDLAGFSPRGGLLFVIQLGSQKTNFKNSFVYVCGTWVSEIEGSTKPEHALGDYQARIAATAVAHSGMVSIDQSFYDLPPEVQDELPLEDVFGIGFAYYPNDAGWGKRANGSATFMANNIARAIIGVFSSMDKLNPRLNIEGQQPWSGLVLNVDWKGLLIILFALLASQLVMGVGSLFWFEMQKAGMKRSADE